MIIKGDNFIVKTDFILVSKGQYETSDGRVMDYILRIKLDHGNSIPYSFPIYNSSWSKEKDSKAEVDRNQLYDVLVNAINNKIPYIDISDYSSKYRGS